MLRLLALLFTLRSCPLCYDRDPGGPEAIGVSIRTNQARYTGWQNWKSGEVLARELYDEAHQPEELQNRTGDDPYSTLLRDMETRLRAQFPTTYRP